VAFFPNLGDNREKLIASDGTWKLKQVDVKSWKHDKTISVHRLQEIKSNSPIKKNAKPNFKKENVKYLNELERVPGFEDYLFVNVFLKNEVLLVYLKSGLVIKTYDFSDLKAIQLTFVKNKTAGLREEMGIDKAN
jgi:glutamine cyclotransferase